MDDKLKYKYFQYYQDYCFFKKIEVNKVEDLAKESLEKGYDDLYAFVIKLLCQYAVENQKIDKFFAYLSDLKKVANAKGGFPAVHVLINEGYYQIMVEQDYKKAILSLQEAKIFYENRSLNHPPTLYYILQYLGVCYCNLFDYVTAYQYFTDALKFYLNKTFRFHKAITYNWLAIIETKHHLTSQALEKCLKSARILKHYSIENRYADVLNTIGLLYIDLDKFTEAEKTFKESIEIATKINISFINADAYNNLGMLYLITEKPLLSIENYQKSLLYRDKDTQQSKYGFTMMNLGNAYRNSGDYPKAKEHILQAIEITKKFNDEVFWDRCYSNLSLVYLREKDYKNAEEFLQKAKTLAEKNNDSEGLMYVYNYYIELYKEMGNMQKVKEYEIFIDQTHKELNEIKMNTTKDFLEWIKQK